MAAITMATVDDWREEASVEHLLFVLFVKRAALIQLLSFVKELNHG